MIFVFITIFFGDVLDLIHHVGNNGRTLVRTEGRKLPSVVLILRLFTVSIVIVSPGENQRSSSGM